MHSHPPHVSGFGAEFTSAVKKGPEGSETLRTLTRPVEHHVPILGVIGCFDCEMSEGWVVAGNTLDDFSDGRLACAIEAINVRGGL